MHGDREKCIAAGASDYVTKPVDMDELLNCTERWRTSAAAATSAPRFRDLVVW